MTPRTDPATPVRLALIVAALLAAIVLPGCPPKQTGQILQGPPEKDYDRPLPPGASALRKITDPAMIPDFTGACANPGRLGLAISRSLDYLAKPSSRSFFPVEDVSHERVVASLERMQELLGANLSPEEMNRQIREEFDVYISIGCDDRGTVLYTGYYTPVFRASPTRTARYRYPIYRQPDDLVKKPDGTILGRRLPDGRIVKYPDRRRIERSGMLAGRELYWLADPFEVYVVHVQGSARLRLPDGKVASVGYAANNGWDYVSVGRELIRDGKIPSDRLSLQSMMAYFRAHPEEVNEYVWRNPRFVFFTEGSGGPRGSLNEEVVPFRSIATDKAIFPRASLTYVDTSLPRPTENGIRTGPYAGFACDQDTGGAIRAPGRCDVYMGEGPVAGQLAGRTRQEGKLYYLFLKRW